MSSYLTFRKNGVELASYSRSSLIYQALVDNVQYGEWGNLKTSCMEEGVRDLEGNIERYKRAIQDNEALLPYIKTLDEGREIQQDIRALQSEIKNCEEAIQTLQVYLQIFDVYQQKPDDKYEWMID